MRVGKIIAAKAGYKRAALELGGNDPLIILDDLTDDDLDKAAELAVAGATKNSGQRCTAVKRILVQERIADRFVPLVLDEGQEDQVRRSDGPDDRSRHAWCTRRRRKLFERRVHMAAEQGAKILYNPGRKGAVLPPITVDFVPHRFGTRLRRDLRADHADRPGSQ